MSRAAKQSTVTAFRNWLMQGVDVPGLGHVYLALEPRMECMRCGASGMLILNVDPTDVTQEQCFCIHSCEGSWECRKCDGARVPRHAKWCRTEHPTVYMEWAMQLEKHRAIVAALLPYAKNVETYDRAVSR